MGSLLGGKHVLGVTEARHHARIAHETGHHRIHAHHHRVHHWVVSRDRLSVHRTPLLHLLQLLTLKFVELALSLLGYALFALAFRKRSTHASFPFAITFVGGDGTQKTSLRWWRFVRYIDKGSPCFPRKFFLSLCRT